MTGDVAWTSAGFDGSGNVTGSSTIQASAVESSMLNDNIVSGLEDIGAALAITDEIIVSDGGAIKRADLSRLSTMLAGNGLLDSSGKLDLNIDTLSAGTVLHQTQDHFLFSDNGEEKKISFSNLEDAIFANMNVSSTGISVAEGGDITLDDASIVFGKLAAAAVVTEAEGRDRAFKTQSRENPGRGGQGTGQTRGVHERGGEEGGRAQEEAEARRGAEACRMCSRPPEKRLLA